MIAMRQYILAERGEVEHTLDNISQYTARKLKTASLKTYPLPNFRKDIMAAAAAAAAVGAANIRMTTPNGIPIPRMPGVVINKPAFNVSKFNTTSRMQDCNPVSMNGADYVARISMPSVSDEEKDRIRMCVFERLPILRVDAIPELPNGSYLYIVSDKGMFMNRVYSKLEIGSIHAMLAHRTDADVIFCAGEMRISTKEDGRKLVEYNQMSGTFMLYRTTDEKESMELIHNVFRIIADRFRDVLDVEFKDAVDFLKIPLSEEEISAMRACGYNVDVFKKEDEKSCRNGTFLRKYLKEFDEHLQQLRSMLEIGQATEKQISDKKREAMSVIISMLQLLKATKLISEENFKRLWEMEDPEAAMAELKAILNFDEVLLSFNSKKMAGGRRRKTRGYKRLHRRRRTYRK